MPPIPAGTITRYCARHKNPAPKKPVGWAIHEKLIIATVPHTGTNALKCHFFWYYPDLQDFPHKIVSPELEKIPGRQLVCTHFRQETKRILDLPWPKITPIRDPMLTVISQVARKGYDKNRIKPERIIEAWKLFIKYYPQLNIVNVQDITTEWVTSTKKFDLHQAYENGDCDFVRDKLKEDTWDQIVELEPLLRPIFEKEGFGPFPWYT